MLYELFNEIEDNNEPYDNSYFSCAFLNAFLHTI